METLFIIARYLHIIGGFTALFMFWIPIVTKKGGKKHILAGWIYTLGMIIVAVSAFYMGVYRIFWDPFSTPEQIAFSWFLIFISILSSATAWYGLRVLRFKKRTSVHKKPLDLFIPLLLVISGIGISIYGYRIQFPLLSYFPFVGIFLGISQLFYWLRVPKLKMQWWNEHLVGMLSCSISTITAFTVFGVPRLLAIETVSLWLWFLPSILIVPLIIGFSMYYTRRFNTPKDFKSME